MQLTYLTTLKANYIFLNQFRVAKEMVIEGKGASNRRPLMTLQ